MIKIKFRNLDNRFMKVSFTKLLRNEGNMTLDVAKHTTDDLLNLREVCIDVESDDLARILIEKAKVLGVIGEVI